MSTPEPAAPAPTATPVVPGSLPYKIVGPVIHKNQWNDRLQTVQSGSEVRATWNATGDLITVFVPDTDDLVSTADQLIRAQGAQLSALRGLNG